MTSLGLNWIDYAFLGIIFFNFGLGIWRGLFAELLAIFVWIFSLLAATLFSPLLGSYFREAISQTQAQNLISFILIFVSCYFAGIMFRLLFLSLLPAPSFFTRLLGGILGAVKALLLCTLIVFLLSMTTLREHEEWAAAKTPPIFTSTASWIAEGMPENGGQDLEPYLRPLKTKFKEIHAAVDDGKGPDSL